MLRADHSLAIFPVLGFLFGALAFVILVIPGVIGAIAADQEYVIAPFALLGAYGATYASIYFNVALAAAASQSLDGKDTTLQDGLAVSRSKRGLIAKWAGIQFAVGMLLRAIEGAGGNSPAGRIIAGIVAALIGTAWAIATFFVIPVLALEGVGPGDALKRSGSLIKQRWGEGLVGSASISLVIFLVILIPALALGGLAAVTYESTPVAAYVAIGFLIGVVLAASVIGSALGVIFRVALYRFAQGGEPAPGFDSADLENAFGPRGRGASV